MCVQRRLIQITTLKHALCMTLPQGKCPPPPSHPHATACRHPPCCRPGHSPLPASEWTGSGTRNQRSQLVSADWKSFLRSPSTAGPGATKPHTTPHCHRHSPNSPLSRTARSGERSPPRNSQRRNALDSTLHFLQRRASRESKPPAPLRVERASRKTPLRSSVSAPSVAVCRCPLAPHPACTQPPCPRPNKQPKLARGSTPPAA